MFGLIRNCFGSFAFSGFTQFWQRSKRNSPGRQFEIDDGFVPIAGKSQRQGFGIPIPNCRSLESIVDEDGTTSLSRRSDKNVVDVVSIGTPKKLKKANGSSIKSMPTPSIRIETSPEDQSNEDQQSSNNGHQQQLNSRKTTADIEGFDDDQMLPTSTKFERRRNSSYVPLSEKSARDDFVNQTVDQKFCGRLRVSVQFSEQKQLLILVVNELTQLVDDSVNERGTNVQVRLALLSSEGRVQKALTKFVAVGLTPTFNQTFAFGLQPEQLAESVVRFRLYARPKHGRTAICVGECFLRCCLVESFCDSIITAANTKPQQQQQPVSHFLSLRAIAFDDKRSMSLFPSLLSLNAANNGGNKSQVVGGYGGTAGRQSPPSSSATSLVTPTTNSCTSSLLHHSSSVSASRRSSTVDDSGRFCSLPQSDGTPEVLLSLCYFEDQARLVVGVQKASGLSQSRIAATSHDPHQSTQEASSQKPPPDSFVRISAHSHDGVEVGKHKSDVVKASSEPMYSAQAVFQIGRSDLEMTSVQVMLFTFHGILRRKALLGQICVGEERCSSQDAQTHWQEMIQGMGTTVDKWHHLESPPPSNKK